MSTIKRSNNLEIKYKKNQMFINYNSLKTNLIVEKSKISQLIFFNDQIKKRAYLFFNKHKNEYIFQILKIQRNSAMAND